MGDGEVRKARVDHRLGRGCVSIARRNFVDPKEFDKVQTLENEKRRAAEHEKWLKSPEGIKATAADAERKIAEQKRREALAAEETKRQAWEQGVEKFFHDNDRKVGMVLTGQADIRISSFRGDAKPGEAPKEIESFFVRRNFQYPTYPAEPAFSLGGPKGLKCFLNRQSREDLKARFPDWHDRVGVPVKAIRIIGFTERAAHCEVVEW